MIAGNGEASAKPPKPGYLWDQPQALVSWSEAVGTRTPFTAPVNSRSGRKGWGQDQVRERSPAAAIGTDP